MKLWIIYSKIVLDPNKNNALNWMLEEAEALDIDAEIIFTEDLFLGLDGDYCLYHKGRPVDKPDVAFLRCYDFAMIDQLEHMGVMTLNNAQAMHNCLDKWKTHQLLTKAQVPTPQTLYSDHPVTYEHMAAILGLPFILKDVHGKKGEQVFLIQTKADFLKAEGKCEKPLYQKYVETSFGRDIRVHVVGQKAVTSVLRVSDGDFKSNFSQGGHAYTHELDAEVSAIAVKSSQALGLDFSGVDILFTSKGYTVCEVNGVPGFRTVGLTSNYNMPRAMLNYIKEKYYARMDHL